MKQRVKTWLKTLPMVLEMARAVNGRINAIYFSILPPRDSADITAQIASRIGSKPSVFFVQVGSNDGKQGHPLHALIKSHHHWRGIFIEPVGFLLARLKRNYGNDPRFIFEQIAISPTQGAAEFFYVSEEAQTALGDSLPYWHDQVGSFDRQHIEQSLDGKLTPYIVSELIPTKSLSAVFYKHGVKTVDVLHVDTEGHDYTLLTTIDFAACKPTVILFEHKHLSRSDVKRAASLLKVNGYRCMRFKDDTLATLKT